MAQSKQPLDLELPCQRNHRGERFGCESPPPRIDGEHVTRHGFVKGVKAEACAAEQLSCLTRSNQVRTGGPAFPFAVAPTEKRARIADRSMTRPVQVFRDGRVI